MTTRAKSILAAFAAILAVVLSLIACQGMTVAERQRLQFDALQPKKGANQAQWPTVKVREEKPATAPAIVTTKALASAIAFPPDEEEGTTNFPAATPANATFTFEVVGQPRSYGLWRSSDGGKTKTVWVKWVNDLYDKNFWQSVTLMCDGPTNRLIQVGTWSSNSW